MAKQIGRIVGPPGTGKTTEILRLMSAACDKYDHTEIGASSLTKAAVQEMRSRVARASGVEGKVNKNIKTMHAHGFALLGLKKENVAEHHLHQWNEDYPEYSMTLSGPAAVALEQTEGAVGLSRTQQRGTSVASKLLAKTMMNRLRMVPMEAWSDNERAFNKRWKDWMFQHDLTDYTGMLEQTLVQRLRPDIRVLFVDEAQDMSPLQAAIAKFWSEDTDTTIYAGDYQQAIFRFAGASPEVFLDLAHTWPKELRQSYRVPRKVLAHAMRIISKATDCEQFEYSPRDEDGEYLGFAGQPDLSLDGNHMVICRYRQQAYRWSRWLLDHGVPFKNDYRKSDRSWNPCDSKLWEHARTYIKLMTGHTIDGTDLVKLFGAIKKTGNVERGKNEELLQSINSMDDYNLFNMDSIKGLDATFCTRRREFNDLFPTRKVAVITLLQKMWDRPQDILKEPAVTVGTIHSVKGGEADNVWIEAKCGKGYVRRTAAEGRQAINDEIRIAYVAATRARKRLGFVNVKTKGAVSPYYSVR